MGLLTDTIAVSEDGRDWRELQDWLRAGCVKTELSFRLEEELEFLDDYMRGFAERLLLQEHGNAPILRKHAQNKKGELKELFRLQAERTGGIISSRMIIADAKTLERAVYEGSSSRMRSYSEPTKIDEDEYEIGFIQAVRPASKAKGQQRFFSTPCVALDESVSVTFTEFEEGLLDALREIIEVGNHDWIHHITSDYLRDDIADTAIGRPDTSLRNIFISKDFTDETIALAGGYEGFLLASHAATVQHLYATNARFAAKLNGKVERFCRSLRQFVRDVDALENWTEPMKKDENHRIVHYLGNFALVGLLRYLPATHPLVDKVIEQIQALDPKPQIYARDFCSKGEGFAMPRIMKDDDTLHLAYTLLSKSDEGLETLRGFTGIKASDIDLDLTAFNSFRGAGSNALRRGLADILRYKMSSFLYLSSVDKPRRGVLRTRLARHVVDQIAEKHGPFYKRLLQRLDINLPEEVNFEDPQCYRAVKLAEVLTFAPQLQTVVLDIAERNTANPYIVRLPDIERKMMQALDETVRAYFTEKGQSGRLAALETLQNT